MAPISSAYFASIADDGRSTTRSAGSERGLQICLKAKLCVCLGLVFNHRKPQLPAESTRPVGRPTFRKRQVWGTWVEPTLDSPTAETDIIGGWISAGRAKCVPCASCILSMYTLVRSGPAGSLMTYGRYTAHRSKKRSQCREPWTFKKPGLLNCLIPSKATRELLQWHV